jgi:hypothetical protein
VGNRYSEVPKLKRNQSFYYFLDLIIEKKMEKSIDKPTII